MQKFSVRHMHAAFAIALVSLMGLVGARSAAAASTWSSVIQFTAGGYSGSTSLSGFPVLVRISPQRIPGFRYSDCKADGGDLRFTSADGTVEYPHEIDEWNPDGESLVWVRLDLVPGGTAFQMFYGNPSAVAADSKETWNAAAGAFYGGVWHFAETISSDVASTVKSADSAQHLAELNLDAAAVSEHNVSSVGVIGNSRTVKSELGGGTLTIPNYDALALGDKFTVSFWMVKDIIEGKEDIWIQREKGANNSCWRFYASAGSTRAPFNSKMGAFAAWNWTDAANFKTLNTCYRHWHHYALAYSANTVTAYCDGVQCGTYENATGKVVTDNGKALSIMVPGRVDECRLLATPASDDWMKAEYDTVAKTDFVTASAVKSVQTSALIITSSLDTDLGIVSPTYQVLSDLTDGQTVELRATEGEQTVSDVLKVRIDGWKLYRQEADGSLTLEEKGDGNSYDYVHSAGTVRRFVWQAKRLHALALTASAEGTYAVDGVASSGTVWVEEGEHTISAIPVEGKSVVGFAAVGCDLADASFATQTVSVVRALTLSAAYADGPAAYGFGATATVGGYAGGDAELVGFPVLVRVSETRIEGFRYQDCLPGGSDLAFFSADGTIRYPHEIERWDPSGESLVWVRVPRLSGSATEFQIVYGLSVVPSDLAQRAKKVWSSANGAPYGGVWHFGETIAADVAATVKSVDSAKRLSALDLDVSPSGAVNVSSEGAVGNGRTIRAGSTSGKLIIPNVDSLAFNDNFTVSFWGITDVDIGGAWQDFTYRTEGWRFYSYRVNSADGKLNASVSWEWSSTAVNPKPKHCYQTWRHYALDWKGNALNFYCDGELVGAYTNPDGFAMYDNGGTIGIEVPGRVDEYRLLPASVSTTWVKAEYDTVANADFVTVSEVRSLATDMLTITAAPEELGTVSPAYQVTTEIRGGDVWNLRAEDGVQTASDTMKVRFVGWKLYRANQAGDFELVDQAETNACDYVHPAGAVDRFEWQLKRIPAVRLPEGDAGGTFAVDGVPASGTVWLEEGEHSVSVAPAAGKAFFRFAEDDFADPTANPLVFSITAPRTLTPICTPGPRGYRGETTMTVCGYTGGDETLENFPVLVRLSPERIRGFDYACANAAGTDLAFFSTDGRTVYPHQVDTWNPEGETLVWVRIPNLSGVSTKFRFAFGLREEPTDAASRARLVWHNAAGSFYGGVWHFNEPIAEGADAQQAASADSAKRLSALAMDAHPYDEFRKTDVGSAMFCSTNAAIGLGRRLSSGEATDSILRIPSYDQLGLGGTFSFSGWICCHNPSSGYESIVRRPGDVGQWSFIRWTGSRTCDSFRCYFNKDESSGSHVLNVDTALDNWRHFAVAFSNNVMRFYWDGEKTYSCANGTPITDNGGALGVGGAVRLEDNLFGGSFRGSIDEFRLLATPVSDAWVKAEFETVTVPDYVKSSRVHRNDLGLCIIVR